MNHPSPAQEIERLRALHRLELLDSEPDPIFDDLVALAARLMGTPIAALNLIDADRQWTKAGVGIEFGTETAREDSFCTRAIAEPGRTLVVPDATEDARFADNPHVAAGLRYYAGAPVLDADGYALGALCVADTVARVPQEADLEGLRVLAAAVSGHLGMRREKAAAEAVAAELATVIDQAPDAFVAMDVHGRIVEFNRQAELLFGHARADALGRTVGELIVPHGLRDAHAAGTARHMAGGEPRVIGRPVEVPALHADGHEVPIELTIAAVGEGAELRYNAFCRDISERRLAEREREDESRAIAALSGVARELARNTDARILNGTICRAAAEMSGAQGAILFAEHPEGGLVAVASEGVEVDGFRLTPDAPSVTLTAYRTGEAMFVADACGDARVASGLRALTLAASLALQPVDVDGRTAGVLALHWTEPLDALPERSGRLLAALADEAAVAMRRGALFGQLQELSRTDGLTGIANRRALDDDLSERLATAEAPLCVVLLDLDRFKAYNDTHGHPAGDRLLKACAASWNSTLRGSDLLARYGGEEFALVLPGCPAKEALRIVERLRSRTPGDQTCSAGIAEWTAGESAGELLERADQALYAAKAAGRDVARIAA